jgi:S-adenosylmethionine uptake transporter
VEALTPPAAPSAAHQLRLAVTLALIGEGVLTAMDTVIKALTAHYPTFEIAFLRFACGSLFATVYYLAAGRPHITDAALKYHGMRAALVVVTASSFFYALSVLPIADAMALSFISPLFVVLFGVVLLGETLRTGVVLALAAGLAGMLVIISGKLGTGTYTASALTGVAAVLLSAVTYALVLILLRARANVDPVPVIALMQNLLPALLLAPFAFAVWRTPTNAHVALFLVVGAMGVSGHLLLTHAFKRAEVGRLAPIHYTILVWGILFGWLFFNEVPGQTTLFGAVLIIVATLLAQGRA